MGNMDVDKFVVGHRLEKQVFQLKEPARRAKKALQVCLEKSIKNFHDQAAKSTSEEKKSLFLRKREKIHKDLEVLKVLSEDDVVRYALLMLNKIIPIASNPRVPRQDRMKARVATHKPLSSHLTRLKQKLGKDQEETSAESEMEQDNNTTNTTTLNKINFNNTVVLMRKDVRRAKVHIIHKLTRNIKKLRTIKGKEEKVAKFQRKAERLHKKVIHIKELQDDEISKFALSTTQNLSQLATDIKAPTTSQALATVAIHPFVASHVKDFKTKHPDWQKTVPTLLKKKNKKRKLNLDTKEGDGKNTSTEISPANVESGCSQLEDDDDSSEGENAEGSDDSGNVEEAESDNSENENGGGSEYSENEESDVQDIMSDQSKSSENSSDSEEEASTTSANNNKIVKNTIVGNSKKTKLLTKDSRKIQKIPEKSNKKLKNNKISKTKEEEEPSISLPYVKPVKDEPKVIDPFFVTTTNEEYVTSQVPITNDNSLTDDNFDHSKPSKIERFNNMDYKNKWERTDGVGKYGKFNKFQGAVPYKTQKSSFERSFNASEPKMDKLVFGNRKERRKALNQPQVEEKVEKLHPSWEAKKKQSSIIPFQGKKVTFD